MTWYYNGESVGEIDSQFCGFVYKITNKTNNKQYIGKKALKFKKTKIIKGKKRRVAIDSNWKGYFGSSEALNEDVKVLGEENFHREILRFCKTKSEMSYYELKWQVILDVLLAPDKYYNEWVFVKIRRSHLLTKNALLSEQDAL